MTKQPIKQPQLEPTSNNNTPDRWLVTRILANQQLLAGAFWANWFTLTWCFLLRGIEVNVATGMTWFLFLAGAAVVSAW